MTPHPNRREFVRNLAGAAIACAASTAPAQAPSDKVVLGFMGLGGRGCGLLGKFLERKDIEVAYLCDVDARRLPRAAKLLEAAGHAPAKTVQDFRRILEDKRVHAIVTATPDHWHVPSAILACQAGKDAYIEKPMAHNIREGRLMIDVAKKYGRAIQVGMQSRSCSYVRTAIEHIRSGALGKIQIVKVINMMLHGPMKATPDEAPPKELDYDLWCGPAAKLPYNPGRRWLNFREYSCGPIAGDAVHQLDQARQLMGDPPAPASVGHSGGIRVLRDGRDTPDTQIATFDYGDFTLLFEAALWTGYQKKTPSEIRDTDDMPNWPFNGTRIEIFGDGGFMYFGRHGDGWQAFDSDGKITRSVPGQQADREHIENFIACIRSRGTPIANAEQGHQSVLLCHLADIAWRTGDRKLAFDAKSETFPGDAEANRLLGRTYRDPWAPHL
ncbi:MAG TPA: Gfo/Idh/MocA family oxidoreductase [Verrucomicrobiae bacterium]|nr:Gfo/Idh/MocA family oxidoreductase [Verrucomicrobiae bacterium]